MKPKGTPPVVKIQAPGLIVALGHEHQNKKKILTVSMCIACHRDWDLVEEEE